jgi:hypothetical protein
MHIEKNMFDNIFNTVMDVKRKTNDKIKARLDLALFYNRKNMELVCDGSRVAKPRASFVLEKNAQLLFHKWLKSLRFPDEHASNISRLAIIGILSMDMSFILKNTGMEERYATTVFVLRDQLLVSLKLTTMVD